METHDHMHPDQIPPPSLVGGHLGIDAERPQVGRAEILGGGGTPFPPQDRVPGSTVFSVDQAAASGRGGGRSISTADSRPLLPLADGFQGEESYAQASTGTPFLATCEQVHGDTVFPTSRTAASKGSSGLGFSSRAPFCQVANGGCSPYQLFLATSTGFFAVEHASGRLEVHPASRPRLIPASEAIAFWSCASGSNARPAGVISLLACSNNALTSIDVRGQSALGCGD